MNTKHYCYFWLVPAVLLLCAGCGSLSKQGRYNIRIHRNEALEDVAIQVDIVGASKADAWTVSDVNEYWSRVLAGHRDPNAITVQFSPGKPNEQVLKASKRTVSGQKYSELLDATTNSFLVVISDYPSVIEDRDVKADDPRFHIVSLKKHDHGMWTSEIPIEITKGGTEKPPR